MRLAALVSHPIQYQAPLFRALAVRPDVELHVLFCSSWGAGSHRDPGFGVDFSWDTPLVAGYQFSILDSITPGAEPTSFFSAINPSVGRLLSKGGFDAIWVHGWSLATHWLAFASAIWNGVPILLRGETNLIAKPSGAKAFIRERILRRLFCRIARFLAIGNSNMQFYMSYGVPRDKIHLAPYTVDNRYFIEMSRGLEGRRSELRESEGISPNRPLILFSGKLVDHKAPMDLLLAWAQIQEQQSVSLAFVGDGPLREQMTQFVRERRLQNIHFLGFRNQSDISACYAMADLFVLPSRQEAWGLVVNEAMCFGLPIITSDHVGCAADLVREGENGYTFAAGSVEGLTNCIRKVLADELRRRSMGESSRAIIANWGIDNTAEGIVAALRSVATR